MYVIKQSTGLTVPFFAHDANGDGVTGLVDGGFTKRISKGSGAFGAMTVTITEMENGWYSFPLSSAHTDTSGLLTISFLHASIKSVNLQWRVEARLLDDLATPTNITAGTITTATNVTTVNGLAANVITAAATAADFGTEIAGAVWNEDATAHQTQGTFGQAIGDPGADTNTIYKAVITDARTATVGLDVVNLRDTVEFQRGHHTVTGASFHVDGVGGDDTTGDGTRALPWKTITKALTAVTNNAHDQIILLPNTGGGPTTITEPATVTITAKNYVQIRGPGRDVEVTVASGGVFDITSSGVGMSGFRVRTQAGATSDAITLSGSADFARLERLWIEDAHRDGIRLNVANRSEVIDCMIIASVRDGVRVDSGAGTGSFNHIIGNVIRNCGGSGVNMQGSDASDCRIQHNVIRDNVVGVTIASGVADTVFTDNRLVNNATEISDAGTNTLNEFNHLSEVWGIDATTRQVQGTFGQAIGDPVADTNTIFKAVVTDATGATVGVDVVDLKTQIGTAGAGLTAIDLPDQTMNITGNLSGTVGSVTGAVGSVTGAVGSVTGNVGGNVVGSVGSLGATAKSDVNAEVVDALNVDTYAEPGQEAPGATVSLAKKINYLYKFLRNKITQTSTTLSVYNDAETVVDQKATVSDDATTYTRGEIETGP